jgi:hypothetical protein
VAAQCALQPVIFSLRSVRTLRLRRCSGAAHFQTSHPSAGALADSMRARHSAGSCGRGLMHLRVNGGRAVWRDLL